MHQCCHATGHASTRLSAAHGRRRPNTRHWPLLTQHHHLLVFAQASKQANRLPGVCLPPCSVGAAASELETRGHNPRYNFGDLPCTLALAFQTPNLSVSLTLRVQAQPRHTSLFASCHSPDCPVHSHSTLYNRPFWFPSLWVAASTLHHAARATHLWASALPQADAQRGRCRSHAQRLQRLGADARKGVCISRLNKLPVKLKPALGSCRERGVNWRGAGPTTISTL